MLLPRNANDSKDVKLTPKNYRSNQSRRSDAAQFLIAIQQRSFFLIFQELLMNLYFCENGECRLNHPGFLFFANYDLLDLSVFI